MGKYRGVFFKTEKSKEILLHRQNYMMKMRWSFRIGVTVAPGRILSWTSRPRKKFIAKGRRI